MRWRPAVLVVLLAACSNGVAGSEPSATVSRPDVSEEASPFEPSVTTVPRTSIDPPAAAGATSSTLRAGQLRPIVPAVDISTTEELDDTLEPLRPLDITRGRIEVDDAGIGGGAAGRGWAGFDEALAASLLRNGNTAVAVAVAVNGEIVHEAAFGERIPGEPAAPTDRFRIGSVSKTITAITLLRLVEAGAVGLDEPVGRRIADHLGIVGGAGVDAITPRQLLTHTAGLAKRDDLFFGGAAADCRAAATTGLAAPVGGTPGTSFNYSNLGYCVAGVLIEVLTGTTAERAAYELVLTPLGLTGLRQAPTFDPGPDEVLHPTNLGRRYMEALGPAGGWLASAPDLVRILDSLDPATPGWKPLTPPLLTAMTTPVLDASGSGRGYGMGLILYGPGRWGHTGTIEGTHAMAVRDANGVTWAITVSGEYPSNTSQLESAFNRALVAAGFTPG